MFALFCNPWHWFLRHICFRILEVFFKLLCFLTYSRRYCYFHFFLSLVKKMHRFRVKFSKLIFFCFHVFWDLLNPKFRILTRCLCVLGRLKKQNLQNSKISYCRETKFGILNRYHIMIILETFWGDHYNYLLKKPLERVEIQLSLGGNFTLTR